MELKITDKFDLAGVVASVKPLGEGFINDTFMVKTEGESTDYILQCKNHTIFPNVPEMMNNIEMVTNHIRSKAKDPIRETFTLAKTKEGALYFKDEDGKFWAMFTFIPNTITYERADSTALAYQGGVGIGRFQSLLADFDKPLAETIKGFHNIRWRFQQWDEVIALDPAGRVKDLAEEISWIESRREKMLEFWSKVENGTIPTHVTHNDTKISNILFDAETKDVLCAIDLDTVMSSTSLNDVGDALRSYTNTGAEDDANLDNVSMDIAMYKAYIEGYLSEKKDSLVQSEIDYLAFSGLYITYEQVLRFLMDYIDGDKYYKTKFDGHNLVRTKAQYKLLCSMEEQYDEMTQIVKDIMNK